MNTLIKLIKIAEELDNRKLFKLSDEITNVVNKCVYAQYSVPSGAYNEPMSTRVVSLKDIIQDLNDAEKNRMTQSPRLKGLEFEEGDPADEEDREESIFSINGGDVAGIAYRDESDLGAGTKGIDNLEADTLEKDKNNKGYPTYANL